MFPYQLVCEGKADEVFFSRLLKDLGRDVDVHCPNRDQGGMGKSAIRHVLVGLQSQFDKITKVIVAVDSDDNPAKALADAIDEFTRANETNPAKSYPIPVAANTLTAGSPQTAIVLVPSMDRIGCLDTLLLPSFEAAFPGELVCVDGFCACLTKNIQRSEKRASMIRLRALIAASQRNPGASLANLLEEGHCPIDLNHASFGAIRNVLSSLLP